MSANFQSGKFHTAAKKSTATTDEAARDRQGELAMSNVTIVREWDSEAFHRQVLELEARGYTTRLETYSITPEMDPETGKIIHLYTVQMRQNDPDENQA